MVIIAFDPAQMAAGLSEVVSGLPALLQTMQIVVYVFLVLFLGSIAVIGFRIYAPFWKRLLLRIVFGFFSLVAGIAIRGMIPMPDSMIVKLMQLDMMAGGIVASVIFAVSLFLMSRALSSEGTLKRAIDRLHEKLKKEESRHKPDSALKSPYFIAGVVIIAALLLLTAANFRGFPSMEENMLSTFGISPEDLSGISDFTSNLKTEGCSKVTGILLRHKDDLQDILSNGYENPSIKSAMSREAGEDILVLQRGEAEGVVFVIGVTASQTTCVATEKDVCFCQKA